MKNIESQMPQAICELNSGEGINRHLLVNYQKPPFENPEFRHATALSIDRQAFVDTITQPTLFYAWSAIWRQPWAKGFTQMVNSHFSGCRMEDVWLDK